jgi:hypothetical protein
MIRLAIFSFRSVLAYARVRTPLNVIQTFIVQILQVCIDLINQFLSFDDPASLDWSLPQTDHYLP